MQDGTSDDGRELLGRITLHGRTESVATARRWFRKLTEPLELRRSVDECVLLVSELVTNAILYAEADDPCLVRVEWHRVDDALHVEVHNPGRPERVKPFNPQVGDEHGRGLLLVESLADAWSVGASPYGGTVVAFALRGALRADEAAW